MPYTPPNVYYASVFDGTYTKLDGIQSVSINRGKSRFQDPTGVTQCQIELIPQSTYPAAITIGQFIDIRETNSGGSSAYFVGRITDIERTYDIPYNSGTGVAPGDRVTITVTGGTGVLGSGYGSSGFGSTVDATYSFMTGSMGVANVYAITPANIGYVYGGVALPVPIGQNVIMPGLAPWLDTINETLNTVQYSMDDLDLNRVFKSNGIISNVFAGVYFYPTGQTGVTLSFVDDGSTGASIYKYGLIEYASSIQTAFTQVIVTSSLADQERTSGSAPFVGFSYSTLAATTAQAQQLGDYVLTVNSSKTPTPITIGVNTAIQGNIGELGKLANCPIGTGVTVKFRGSTVNATVCGIRANYYPDYANLTLSLTPSLGTPFTLDSTAFGILNTNRLGYP
jgi:hypothetical protein